MDVALARQCGHASTSYCQAAGAAQLSCREDAKMRTRFAAPVMVARGCRTQLQYSGQQPSWSGRRPACRVRPEWCRGSRHACRCAASAASLLSHYTHTVTPCASVLTASASATLGKQEGKLVEQSVTERMSLHAG
jgi:hypothetical protein